MALLAAVICGLLLAMVGRIGGFSVTVVGWLLPLVMSLTILLVVGRIRSRLFFLWLPWVLFVSFSSMMLGGTESLLRSAILITPVLVGWAASSLVYRARDVTLANRAVNGAVVVSLFIVFVKVFVLRSVAQGRLAPESIASVALAWILLTHFRLTRALPSLLAAVAVLAIPVVGASRGPVVAALSWMAFGLPFIGRMKVLIRAVLLLICLIGLMVYVRPFSDKMILEGAALENLSSSPEDVVQTSGRLAAWELLIEGIVERPILGHGANRSESFLVKNFSEQFAHPHNDYLRLLYDFGVVGLALFIVTAAIQCRRLWSVALLSNGTALEVSAWSGAALFVPFFLLMFVDNVIVYAAFFGNLHFLYIGMAESRHWKKE